MLINLKRKYIFFAPNKNIYNSTEKNSLAKMNRDKPVTLKHLLGNKAINKTFL